jgi:lysozyme
MNLQRVYARLSIDEDRRKKPYKDSVGKLSVGVGRNLDDRGLRDDEIDLMLVNDVAESIGECRRMFRNFDTLNEVRQEVLVNMMFNMGFTKLAGFKRMIAAVLVGDWVEAARQMLDSKWADQVGDRSERLAQAMRKGAW